jgi:uncharacterized protein (TIGR00255 family)
MIQSMTAFASRTGSNETMSWAWEMRGVNARGLDLRMRFPEGQSAIEAVARGAITQRLSRGNVTLNLRMGRVETSGNLLIDHDYLDRVLVAMIAVRDRAASKGLALADPTATEILSQRGVVVQAPVETESDGLITKILEDDLHFLIEDFMTMRRSEGQAIRDILEAQLIQVAALVEAARTVVETRRGEARATLHAALRRVFEDVPEFDEARIAQELALLAVKSDVTEELDRLTAHVAAATAMLTDPKPQGRKLDFLAQEFNREANTLCSKAQSADLTRIGLDLKAVIDQLREQVQNVE